MLEHWIMELKEQKVLLLLSVICLAMIVDFFSGCLAGRLRREFNSKTGINGILRKIASIMLLLFFLPVSLLIPENAGTALLYVMYLGYLIMEVQSILENYQKMGISLEIFEDFLKQLRKKP